MCVFVVYAYASTLAYSPQLCAADGWNVQVHRGARMLLYLCSMRPLMGGQAICIRCARLTYAVRLCSSQDDYGMQAYNHGKLRSLTKAPMLTLHVVGLGAFVHAVA